jgi:PKD repeat protein
VRSRPDRLGARAWPFALLAALLVALPGVSGGAPDRLQGSRNGYTPPLPPSPGVLLDAPAVRGAPSTGAPDALSLGITVTPPFLCGGGPAHCANQSVEARVTLTATGPTTASAWATAWPSVQLAIVLETTPYDGAFDPTAGTNGSDPCLLAGQGHPCEEANAVPLFARHAGEIARAISAAHPETNVTFGLVDYFATLDTFDDSDGQKFHVDVPEFLPASAFGAAVNSSLTSGQLSGGTTLPESDMDDNLLHSSSITALFGTLDSGALGWIPSAHHVILWIGSTAPADPAYVQNYTVSATNHSIPPGSPGLSPSCESAYAFGHATSPPCEGWIASQSGRPGDSIAALAGNASSCVASLGGRCTLDAIDLWSTPTDPASPGWPLGRAGGGPNGSVVRNNTERVLAAGCDLASATGGSWDGPDVAACHTRSGSLRFEGVNATFAGSGALESALGNASFGAGPTNVVAWRANGSIFRYVPYGPVRLADAPDFVVNCSAGPNSTLPAGSCPSVPRLSSVGGVTYAEWNVSSSADANRFYAGERWTASFNVTASGPPFATWPVDACITFACGIAGSQAVAGLFTSATYVNDSGAVVEQSYPYAGVQVRGPPAPQVEVVALPSAGPPPLRVALSATWTGDWPPVDVTWSFGDGTAPGQGPSLSHTFLAFGAFTVSAHAVDALGQSSNATLTVWVVSALSAKVSVEEDATGPPGAMVLRAIAEGGAHNYTFSWELGDGQGASGDQVRHTYAVGLNYTATVSIHDASGLSLDRSIAFAVPARPLTSGAIRSGSDPSCSPGRLVEDLSVSASGGIAPYSTLWEFGDGASAVGNVTILHTYPGPGTYPVRANVTDAEGGSSVSSSTVVIASGACAAPLGPAPSLVLWGSAAAAAIAAAVGAVFAARHRSRTRRLEGDRSARP